MFSFCPYYYDWRFELENNSDISPTFFLLFSLFHLQAVFRRYLRPEKDYLSFSLLYRNGERSLDLVSENQLQIFKFQLLIYSISDCRVISVISVICNLFIDLQGQR